MRAAWSDEYIEELPARMVGLDERAFKEFASIFGLRLRAFFFRRGLSSTDAEDLAVSCVTDISLKVEKYRSIEDGRFDAWVFTLARHAVADWWRKRHASLPLTENLTGDLTGEQSKPDFNVILAVNEAVAQLSENDRTLIRLRDLESENTYAEIGEMLDITHEAARVRHFRALKRLKKLLEADPRIRKILERKNNLKSMDII